MAGREIVLVPGNHDHRLAEPLLEELALAGAAARARAPRGSRAPRPATTIAGWLGGAELRHRLPRDLAARRRLRDPRPLHGLPHEPAAARVHRRGDRDAALRAACRARRRPSDYERVLRPVYGFSYALAQSRARPARRRRPSERAWKTISGEQPGRGPRPPRACSAPRSAAGVPAGDLEHQPAAALRLRRRPLRRGDLRQRRRRRDRARRPARPRRRPPDHRPHPPRRPVRGRRRVAAARRRPPPQHRQLGLRLRLPPPRHPARPLLAGDRHLGRGRRPAAAGPAARPSARARSCPESCGPRTPGAGPSRRSHSAMIAPISGAGVLLEEVRGVRRSPAAAGS